MSEALRICRVFNVSNGSVFTLVLRGRSSSLKGERIFGLESGDVLNGLRRVGADHDEIGLEDCNSFGDKFHQGGARIGGDAGVHRVLEDMRELPCYLGKKREPIRS